jgi:hypothetical protein
MFYRVQGSPVQHKRFLVLLIVGYPSDYIYGLREQLSLSTVSTSVMWILGEMDLLSAYTCPLTRPYLIKILYTYIRYTCIM